MSPHSKGEGWDEVKHETERNLELVKEITDSEFTPLDIHPKGIIMPKLYPGVSDYQHVERFKTTDYICIAPMSVWFTKQFTKEKWLEFLRKTDRDLEVYLLGGKDDSDACEVILNQSEHHKIQNLAGKLSFLQTAALMKDAKMNYVNDSASLHIASSMNAPVTAIFCSTIPAFGFGPLSDNSKVIETKLDLDCRPCGLHGLKRCPEEHFKCATSIEIEDLLHKST
ncbi:MAG: glycosyltransferase family 9 protein [Bacteroidota bacterium]